MLDEEGVGTLIQIAVTKGRKQRPDLEIGICGEHGGEPRSIDFCHRAGLNYVSCSPFRVPSGGARGAQGEEDQAHRRQVGSAETTAVTREELGGAVSPPFRIPHYAAPGLKPHSAQYFGDRSPRSAAGSRILDVHVARWI